MGGKHRKNSGKASGWGCALVLIALPLVTLLATAADQVVTLLG